MAEQDKNLIRYVSEGEFTSQELGLVDPEVLGSERILEALHEWAALSEEERWKQYVEEERERLRRMRPNLKDTVPPEDMEGTLGLVNTYWGHELLSFSLAFAAGKIRFHDIVPQDLIPELFEEGKCSIAQERALFAMVLSSLYWAEREEEITHEEARFKARDIAWLFGISADRISYFVVNDEFDSKIKEYHGIRSMRIRTLTAPTQ